MTNLIQNPSITESIKSYINAPDARTPAAYSIISWDMPKDGFGGSITLEGSRSFINLEVSQLIAFEGLRSQYFHRFSVSHIFTAQKAVTIEATDQDTFKLSADGCVFFEGKAVESNTKSRNFGLEGPDIYASVRSN